MPGIFTISLDFELFWGVHDKRSLKGYGRNILGARDAIPRMLDEFERYGIHGTWATVGLLFFDTKEELLEYLPAQRPQYANPALSPYPRIGRIGPNERQDPYHFGLSLVRRIRGCPHQEIGTHTFSHYYCLEDGQTAETFRADLEAAQRAAARLGIALRSLVFPRNQLRADYLGICREFGIEAVRGNQPRWLLSSEGEAGETLIKRIGRRLDHYVPLTGRNAVTPEADSHGIVNVPSSRFLLPASARSRMFGHLCHRRIATGMTHAAATGQVFHLWWHPHNFGIYRSENIALLRQILEHYRALADQYGMVSRNMGEIAASVLGGLGHAPEGARPAPAPQPRRETRQAARVSVVAT